MKSCQGFEFFRTGVGRKFYGAQKKTKKKNWLVQHNKNKIKRKTQNGSLNVSGKRAFGRKQTKKQTNIHTDKQANKQTTKNGKTLMNKQQTQTQKNQQHGWTQTESTEKTSKMQNVCSREETP